MNQGKFKRSPTLFTAGGLYLLAAAGLWLTSLIAGDLDAGLRILLPGSGEELRYLLVSVVYYLPFLIFPAVLWASKHEGAQDALRLGPIRPADMVRASVVALLSLLAVQNVTMIWTALVQKLGLDVFVSEYVRPVNMTELTLSVVSAAIIAPLGEELLFRGVMLSAWERKGQNTAVMVTAVLFAMLHGSVLGLPGEIFGGIMMALLALWSDSLYAALAFHSVYNAGGVMMNYISSAVATDAAEGALMQSDLLGYMGGFGSVLVFLLHTAVLLAIIVMVTRRMQVRYTIRRAFAAMQPGWNEPKNIDEFRELIKISNRIDETEMGVGEALVLMAGIVTCLGLYVMDILSMLGG